MSTSQIPCHIDRRADKQGSRPSVKRQARVKKYVTGCGKMSMPSKHHSRQTFSPIIRQTKKFRIGTINLQTAKDEAKLAEYTIHVKNIKHDVCLFHETHKMACYL